MSTISTAIRFAQLLNLKCFQGNAAHKFSCTLTHSEARAIMNERAERREEEASRQSQRLAGKATPVLSFLCILFFFSFFIRVGLSFRRREGL